MEKIDMPIGSTFTMNGEEVQVVKSNNNTCDGCAGAYYKYKYRSYCHKVCCMADERNDKNEVIFRIVASNPE